MTRRRKRDDHESCKYWAPAAAQAPFETSTSRLLTPRAKAVLTQEQPSQTDQNSETSHTLHPAPSYIPESCKRD